jgi:hypothetical protein
MANCAISRARYFTLLKCFNFMQYTFSYYSNFKYSGLLNLNIHAHGFSRYWYFCTYLFWEEHIRKLVSLSYQTYQRRIFVAIAHYIAYACKVCSKVWLYCLISTKVLNLDFNILNKDWLLLLTRAKIGDYLKFHLLRIVTCLLKCN